MITQFWQWLSADGGRSTRLFFACAADAMHAEEPRTSYPARSTQDWVAAVSQLEATGDDAISTLAIAAIRGLILDRLLTGGCDRTDDALAELASMLSNSAVDP